MKKDEILALGVREEKIGEFQELYNRDLNKAVVNVIDRNRGCGKGETRTAIISMLPMVRNEESLQKILKTITHFYLLEHHAAQTSPSAEPEEREEHNENQNIV